MNVLCLHQGAIGDFLLTLPLLQSVRKRVQADEVRVITTSPAGRLCAGKTVVDRAGCPETSGLYRLFRADLELSPPLAEWIEQADLVLNLLGGVGEAVHRRLQAAGPDRLLSIDPRPQEATRQAGRHIALQWREDLRMAGLDIDEPKPARMHLEGAERLPRRVIIHPGSGGVSKCWPLEKFAHIADELESCDVMWMLGPAEGRLVRAMHDRDEPVIVEHGLAESARHLASASLYIGNDSGITHLAASLGVPTVAVFSATDPRVWRPLGDHVITVSRANVLNENDEIDVETAAGAVARLLQKTIPI